MPSTLPRGTVNETSFTARSPPPCVLNSVMRFRTSSSGPSDRGGVATAELRRSCSSVITFVLRLSAYRKCRRSLATAQLEMWLGILKDVFRGVHPLWLIEADPHRRGSLSLRPPEGSRVMF